MVLYGMLRGVVNMRIARNDADRTLAEKFCETHPRGHFMQSTGWAKVKVNWKNEIIIAENGSGQIIGMLSVLVRKIPFFGNLMYCPRGPVCDIHDADVLGQLRDGAAVLERKYRAMALRMEPDVPENDEIFRSILGSLGFQIRDNAKSTLDLIQPRSVFRLNLRGKTEDELFAGFHKKLRYNIRLAKRHGVEIRNGTRTDLPVFYALMVETARRDGFIPRPLEYYERVWDSMGPDHIELLLAYLDGRAIAAAMPIHYARCTWYVYGASATVGRSAMPCHLLQWEMIKQALHRSDEIYDLLGFLEITDENDPHSGLFCFKKRFGGEMTHYIGEVMIPYRPVAYRLYRVAEKALFIYRQNKTGGNRHEKGSNGNDEKGDFWHHGTRDALGTFLPIGLHEAGNRRG